MQTSIIWIAITVLGIFALVNFSISLALIKEIKKPIDAGGPQKGQPVPDWELISLDGNPISGADLSGQSHYLVFVDELCPTCIQFLRSLSSAAENQILSIEPRTYIIWSGSIDSEAHEILESLSSEMGILHDNAEQPIAAKVSLKVTPAVIKVNSSGTVESVGIPDPNTPPFRTTLQS